LKYLILIACCLPLVCFAQKEYCKQIEERRKTDGTLVYRSPELKNVTVVKETAPPCTLLHIHFVAEYSDEVGYGIEILLDDGTKLKDEEGRIYFTPGKGIWEM